MRARLVRPALAASVACAVVLAGGAVAAPAAPVCKLVKDAKGDAAILSDQPTLDVVSGDLASDAKSITAVMRLDGPPGGANPQAAGGTRYYFSFKAPGSADAQYLAAIVPFAGATTFSSGVIVDDGTRRTFTPDSGEVKGAIKGNEITITAPLDAFAERAKVTPGTKLSGLTAESFAVVGLLLVAVDDASGKSYVAGTKSCVKPV